MNETQFKAWCQRVPLPDSGMSYVCRSRSSGPARSVGSHGRNVRGFYPSRKNGFTVQFGSHTCELCGIYEYEYDDNVLEYFDRPETGSVQYILKNGRKRPFPYTADFLVLAEQGIFLDEWKTQEALVKLSEEYPDRYGTDDKGVWHFYPGEEYANELGIQQRLRSTREINQTLFRNLQFLEDYLREDTVHIPAEKRDKISRIVEKNPGINLLELLGSLSGHAVNDYVYSMVAMGQLYVDLSSHVLGAPDRAQVFLSEEIASAVRILDLKRPAPRITDVKPVMAHPGESILWDGVLWTIMNVGVSHISLARQDGKSFELDKHLFESYVHKGIVTGLPTANQIPKDEAVEIFNRASPKNLKEAIRRYQIILPRIQGEKPRSDVPERTERGYWALYRDAEMKYGRGFIGLIPHREKQTRIDKTPERKKELIGEACEEYRESKRKKFKALWRQLNDRLKTEGLTLISFKTFRKKIRKALSAYEEKAGREGKRAAYAIEQIDWTSHEIPIHGDYPFHIVHIDHTQIDLELVSPETGKNLGRLWITLMIDAKTRSVLALSVSFEPPSYRSIMNVFRECVKRHGRLPHTVVVDNGKEFESIYFDTLLAANGILKKLRPPSEPRFGAVIERLVGTMNTTFVHNLWGNTQNSKAGRKMTKAVSPRNLAIWTPERAHARIEEWAYEIYDIVEHSALGTSPREAFQSGQALTGYRLNKLIPYDLDFIMMTLPSTEKGTAKVSRGLVKINNCLYKCSDFQDPEAEGTDVRVRYDPYDLSVAFAYVKGKWRRCLCRFQKTFKGWAERDIQFYSGELRQRMRRMSGRFTVSDSVLAKFLESVEAEEEELFELRRLRAAENRKLLKLSHLDRLLPEEFPAIKEACSSPGKGDACKQFEFYEEVSA